MGNEETLGGFPVKSVVPALVKQTKTVLLLEDKIFHLISCLNQVFKMDQQMPLTLACT